MRPLFVRPLQIDRENSGNAHNNRPRDLRAPGREAGGRMRRNLQSPDTEHADTTEGREFDMGHPVAVGLPNLQASTAAHRIAVTLLTGGSDKPYTFGLTS